MIKRLINAVVDNKFKSLSIATSGLFFFLFILMFFDSASFLTDIGLSANKTTEIIGRRVAMIMLGFSVLLFFARNAQNSPARQAILLATGVTMFGFAAMGSFEFIKGNISSGIVPAIVIESLIWISCLLLWISTESKQPK